MPRARVTERVGLGGHGVPEAVIRRRYGRGLTNFVRLYRAVADRRWFFDNSRPAGPRLVACGEGEAADIADPAVSTTLMEQLS